MKQLRIPAGEWGTTRVFSLSLVPDEARALKSDVRRQLTMLGSDALDPAGIEVFALRDLAAMGLVGYLRDGVDVQETQLRAHSAKLSALEGWVMLVHSLAFRGEAFELNVAAPLTLIGTYNQTAPDTPPVALEAAAAAPYTAPAGRAVPMARKGRSYSVMTVLVLVGVVAIVLWFAVT